MVRMQKVWRAVLVAVVAGSIGAAALSSTALAAGKCDGKAKPCPLQQFLRDNAGTPMAQGDLAAVGKAMEKIEKAGGPDMTMWAKLAGHQINEAGFAQPLRPMSAIGG